MDSESLRIRGNPTSKERCALVAAVTASGTIASTASGTTASTPETDHSSLNGTDETTEPDRTEAKDRIAHRRVCPVCNRKYGSKRSLDGRRQFSVRDGTTICFSQDEKYIYVHES